MHLFDFYDISERFIELINPTSPDKIIALGKYLELADHCRIIDFGCGYAEPLVLWAENFGISAIGIDIREKACERARNKIARKGLSGRIRIVCGKGARSRTIILNGAGSTSDGRLYILKRAGWCGRSDLNR